jgi:hypothetical protein
VHVIRMDRTRRDLEIHDTHAYRAAYGISTLSQQIRAFPSGLGEPLVAVNGDFYLRKGVYTGDPRGLQIMNGELLSEPKGGASFWIDSNGDFHVGNVTSRFRLTWADGKISPFGLNEDRRSNSVMVLYTPSIGPSTHTPRGRDLVLERVGNGPWLPLQAGMTYHARVHEILTGGDTCFTPDKMVLSIRPNLGRKTPTVRVGDVLTFTTGTLPSMVGVKTAIGGGPILISNGERQTWPKPIPGMPVPASISALWDRHPRTAIGWNRDCFFIVEVDGRQEFLSTGMTLNELANYMLRLGCTEAMNLDGGGSSTLWVDGQLVNSPSDEEEREVANAIVIVRKRAAVETGVSDKQNPPPTRSKKP